MTEPRRPRTPRAWLLPAVVAVCVVVLVAVVVIGFADEQGAKALSGLALAVFALGSLVAGLAYGLTALPGTLATRFVGTAVAFGLAAQLLWGVGSLPVLIGCGVSGLLLAQLAFRSGPLHSSLSVIATVDPLLSVALGVVVYDEQLRTGVLPVVGQAVLLVALVVAASALSRLNAVNSNPGAVPG